MMLKTLRFNFALNVAGAIVPFAVSLATVPLYIRHIGDARYGVLSIVWILLGYFGFLDLGLSRAAANALARLRHASQPERARVLVTVMLINLALGCLGALVLAIVGGYLLQHVLAVPEALKAEIAQAFPWIVVLLPLAMVGGVGNGALESRERFALVNLLGLTAVSLGQIVPILMALTFGPSLTIIIPTAVVVRCLSAALLLGVVMHSEGPLGIRHFDRAQVPGLLRYGGWVSVTNIISPLLTSLDQFIIGSVLGVSKLPTYSVPMSLVVRSQVFPSALARTLFPRLSSLKRHEAERLASRALTTVSFGYAALCAPAIAITPVFLSLWIGPAFATKAIPVAEVLFVGAWVNAMAFVPFALLQSQGRPDLTGKFHALEVVPFVALLWWLTNRFGIEGAAAAWTLRCIVDALLLFGAARVPLHTCVQTLVPLGLLLVALGVVTWSGFDAVGLCVTAVVIGTVASLAALLMAEDLRSVARRVFGAASSRLRPDRPARRLVADR